MDLTRIPPAARPSLQNFMDLISAEPWFFGIPLFVGAGLLFAGITGYCGMALLLQRAPWNTAAQAAQ
jgi:hypothetical protein